MSSGKVFPVEDELEEELELPELSTSVVRIDHSVSAGIVSRGTVRDSRGSGSRGSVSYFRGIISRFDAGETVEPEKLKYEDGFEVHYAGELIGTVEKKLGEGAYGTVYGMTAAGGERVAVKTVRFQEHMSPDQRRELNHDLAVEASM